MDFMLVFDWVDKEPWVNYYKTKEDLLLAKQIYENLYDWQIKDGSLILSPAVNYSWDEIDQLF